MNATNLNIRRIDSRREDIRAAMAELRARLSPQGNVVSEAGRRRTIEVFGEPLSPQQVVERICRDVREKGLAAVLDYSARIDKAQLTADTLRVPAAELAQAHAAADPQLLEAVRRVAGNIREFQQAILHRDVRLERPGGYLVAAVSAAGSGGDLRAGRGRRLSLDRADDGRARPGGRRASNWPWSPRRRSSARTTPTCWPPVTSWALPRSIAWAAPRPWPRWPTAWKAFRGSTRSSGPATCSWRWPRSTSSARWTSTRSPARARWW